jgi:hypothetical protein
MLYSIKVLSIQSKMCSYYVFKLILCYMIDNQSRVCWDSNYFWCVLGVVCVCWVLEFRLLRMLYKLYIHRCLGSFRVLM